MVDEPDKSRSVLQLSKHFELEHLDALESSVRSIEIKQVIGAFKANVREIVDLLALPYVLIHQGIVGQFRLSLHARAFTIVQRRGSIERSAVDAEAERLFREEMNNEATRDDLAEHTEETLASLIKFHSVEKSTSALLYAACINSWTAFECVAKDLWVCALNLAPHAFAQEAFSSLKADQTEYGIGRKYVEVGLLAKHGFDLKSCMGTILATKFDFTSLGGIVAAYEGALGKSQELQDLRTNIDLKRLEFTRNLIAHRGGVVDELFKNIAHSTLAVGGRLVVSADEVAIFANHVIAAGCVLVRQVDEQLASL